MLRFRPILPKPPTDATLSVQSQNVVVSKRRPKRKYVRVQRKSRSSKTVTPRSPEFEEKAALVTLQLMPENHAPEPTLLAGVSRCKNAVLEEKNAVVLDRNAAGKKVVESWVTVENVTATCMGGESKGLGCTDDQKVKSLESDTCPGFVTDRCGRVRWVNDAYKRMLVNSKEQQPFPENVVVWLSVKDGAAWCYSHPEFTCGVRLQYTWRNEKCTKMVPCDVWRLDSGGFAWRLDVKAALSLGL